MLNHVPKIVFYFFVILICILLLIYSVEFYKMFELELHFIQLYFQNMIHVSINDYNALRLYMYLEHTGLIDDHFNITEYGGFWREYGYGMVGIYNFDFILLYLLSCSSKAITIKPLSAGPSTVPLACEGRAPPSPSHWCSSRLVLWRHLLIWATNTVWYNKTNLTSWIKAR